MQAIQQLLLVIIVVNPVYADTADPAEQAEKLQQLRDRIGTIKNELASMRGRRDTLQQALEETEKETGIVAADIQKLAAQSVAVRKRIEALGKERSSARDNLDAIRTILKHELQAAYLSGRQERVKLLLSQEDPATIGRMLGYHGYITRARTRLVQAVRTSLLSADRIEKELVEQQAGIEQLQKEQQENSLRLQQEQDKRRRILAQIHDSLRNRTTELSTLEQDEQQLHKLVLSLQQALLDISPGSGQYMPLARLKGKLDWPVAGRITLPYGARQASGNLRSRGIRIATRAGTDIKAIASGRVAFSDWLRGFGMLLIIDHGEGYMSLYGQNRSLYKDVGEWVKRGEVIAAAGNSGGQVDTGLYLELRKNGRPVDPGRWFRGKPVPLQAVR